MSIDYSDMAFPKLACKKKRKSHKKSILKSRKGVCYPFYDGVLSTVQTVREYIKKMCKVDEAERKINDKERTRGSRTA